MTATALGLTADETISPAQWDLVHRIADYPLDFVLEKLCEDGRMTREQARGAEEEFRRFMALIALEVAPLAMIGPLVDEVWHQFVLFTPQYRRFCSETFGFFVDHQPDCAETPVPLSAGSNFMGGYKRYFGELPAIWFEGMTLESVQYYKEGRFKVPPPRRWSGWTGRPVDR